MAELNPKRLPMALEFGGRNLCLQLPVMDARHEEFFTLYQKLAAASGPGLQTLFKEAVEHTREHFAEEERIMEETGFPSAGEHREEHLKLLGEMEFFCKKVEKGLFPFAMAYIREYLPEKFRNHILNIDSQLAMHLKNKGYGA